MKIKNFFSKFFPYNILSSAFGLGFLPVWGNHWSAFLSFFLVSISVYSLVGFEAPGALIAVFILSTSIVWIILGYLGMRLYIASQEDILKSDEKVVMHIFIGQWIILGLCVPAIYHFYIKVSNFNLYICSTFMFCSDWFYKSVTIIPTSMIPFFCYRFMDIVKPWPSSYIDLRYKTAFGKLLESFFNVLYASIIIYIIAFVFFDLLFADFVLFYFQLWKSLVYYFEVFFFL